MTLLSKLPVLDPVDTLSPADQEAQQRIVRAEAQLAKTIWPVFTQNNQHCFERVLEGFMRHRVGEEHFTSVTGYGHDDMGRDVTDAVFAHAFEAESALVRMQMVSGTHALSVALRGCLQRGDRMVCVTGAPYDTLEEVIGIRPGLVPEPQSLVGLGVEYRQLDIFERVEHGEPIRTQYTPEEEAWIRSAKMVYFQRSRGYSLRPSLPLTAMATLIAAAKALNPNIIAMVDNCYGEFVEPHEPTHSSVGADILAGSMIKNPGAGWVPTGGYIAGRQDLVDACAKVLTCPGIGREGGYTFNMTRTLLQGLYMAPGVVEEALKGMSLAAYLMAEQGYWVNPAPTDVRCDIVQAIRLGTPEKLQRFCQCVQAVSPVNNHLTPVPDNIPGYESQVIMAGGTFIEGSSIELSADGPMREPYTVFFQGGLIYAHARLAMRQLLQAFPAENMSLALQQ